MAGDVPTVWIALGFVFAALSGVAIAVQVRRWGCKLRCRRVGFPCAMPGACARPLRLQHFGRPGLALCRPLHTPCRPTHHAHAWTHVPPQSGVNATLGFYGGQAFASIMRCGRAAAAPCLLDVRSPWVVWTRGPAWRAALPGRWSASLSLDSATRAPPPPPALPRSFSTGLVCCLIFFAIDVTARGTPLPVASALRGGRWGGGPTAAFVR